jgi:hypothetical protein
MCVTIVAVCVWGGYKWGRRDAARALRERANAGPNRWEQLSFDASVEYHRRHVLAVESVRSVVGNGTPGVQYQLRNISGKKIAFATGSIQLFDPDGIPVGGVAVGVRDPIGPGQSVTATAAWTLPDQLKSVVNAGGRGAYFWADYVRYDDDTIQSFAKSSPDGTCVGPPSSAAR